MGSKIKLPFPLERPSTSTPATTANDVDIDAISGMSATNVQDALAELKAKGGGTAKETKIDPITGLTATNVQQALEAENNIIKQKIGDMVFSAGVITFYTDTTHNTIVRTLTLGEASYMSVQGCNRNETFYGLNSHTQELLSFSPKTLMNSFGSQSEFYEDYKIKIEYSTDNSTFTTIVNDAYCGVGKTYSVDVRRYLSVTGAYFKVTISGNISKTNTIVTYHGYITSMSIAEANLDYATPFIEGQGYDIGGFRIEGMLEKVVHVKISGNGYEKEYTENIGTKTYTTSAYSYKNATFPTTGSGVYNVEVWCESGSSLKTDVISFNIICVSALDKYTAKYVAVNTAAKTAVNYSTTMLFHFVVYNKGENSGAPIVSVNAVYDGSSHSLGRQTLNVNTGEDNTYSKALEIETEDGGAKIETTITFGNSVTVTSQLDNSASFPIVSNADFVMNAASRLNSDTNPKKILNHAKADTVVASSWTRMSMIDGMDGWTTDSEGRKCLVIPATSKVQINYAPFATMPEDGKVIDITYKVENAADYDEPVITICDNPSSGTFKGLKIKPSNITIHTNDTKTSASDSTQGYNLGDEKVVNMQLLIIPNYNTNYGNFCILYVNGIKKCIFAYADTDDWTHGSYIKLGSQTADLNVYSIRCYQSAFGMRDALQNYYSTLADNTDKSTAKAEDDAILNDSIEIDYEKVVASKKYNYFVVEPIKGGELPSYGMEKTYSCDCNFEMHYPKQSGWDYYIKSARLAGQGTSSMNYWLWNLRVRTDQNTGTKESDAHYATSVSYNGASYTTAGKVKIFGQSSGDVKRITAKKNYASSSQSHKMGTTAAFNDLHDAVVGANEANARTAVLQYPAYGFIRKWNETTGKAYYECLGLFTIGADKGDKTTFGYDNATYKNTLVSLEGTNHNIRATMFNYPYNDNMVVGRNENGDLCVGVKEGASFSAGWEISNVNGLETDSTKSGYNATSIKSAIETAFKPAYEVAYRNNPLIIGGSISVANADVAAWKARKTTEGRVYGDLELWDETTYDLYTLNLDGTAYVATGINMLTDLGLTSSSVSSMTTAQKNELFISKRISRFKANASKSWNIEDSLFCLMFCLIFGASDNFGKNTYPYTFKSTTTGNLSWRWRNDDLDTIFDNDNQGKSAKTYSIEYSDFTDSNKNAYVFKGENSAFWTLLQKAYPTECLDMGKRILTAMYERGTGTTYIGRLLSFFNQYYWQKAELYFPRTAYNIDSELCYENAYPNYVKGTYEVDTNPLQQALGSHYEAELYWVERRMLYCMSWFKCGVFAEYSSTALGRITFRTQTAQSMTLTPAMDMYPTIISGENSTPTVSPNRVLKGVPYTTASVGGTNTNVYIPCADYLQDIGDLSKLQIDASGNVELQVGSKRLQRLLVGDSTKEVSGLSTLNIGTCPSLTKLDARNLTTLTGAINLSGCKRLRELYLNGTSVTSFSLKRGSKVETIYLPDTLTSLALDSIEYLTTLNYTSVANWNNVDIKNCPDALIAKVLTAISSASSLSKLSIAFKASPSYNTLTESQYDQVLALIDNTAITTTFSGCIMCSKSITAEEYLKLYNAGISYMGNVEKRVILSVSKTEISGSESLKFNAQCVPSDDDATFNLYVGNIKQTPVNGIATYNGASLNTITGQLTTTMVSADYTIKVTAQSSEGIESTPVTITVKKIIKAEGIVVSGSSNVTAVGDYPYTVTLYPTDTTDSITDIEVEVLT